MDCFSTDYCNGGRSGPEGRHQAMPFTSKVANRSLVRHSRQVAHGDIKSENILVTSWNWVYITDFASYKPVYLPEDDPADYSFYFDTSGRRTCYIAPERFYSSVDDVKQSEGTVTEAMDVFSLGCVLAELFLDGRETFTLSQLFLYRSGELSMESHLSIIKDENIRVFTPLGGFTFMNTDLVLVFDISDD